METEKLEQEKQGIYNFYQVDWSIIKCYQKASVFTSLGPGALFNWINLSFSQPESPTEEHLQQSVSTDKVPVQCLNVSL